MTSATLDNDYVKWFYGSVNENSGPSKAEILSFKQIENQFPGIAPFSESMFFS